MKARRPSVIDALGARHGPPVERRAFLGMIAIILAVPWAGRLPRPRARWTRDEREILEVVARRKGWGWAERHAHLILDQARAVGQL